MAQSKESQEAQQREWVEQTRHEVLRLAVLVLPSFAVAQCSSSRILLILAWSCLLPFS